MQPKGLQFLHDSWLAYILKATNYLQFQCGTPSKQYVVSSKQYQCIYLQITMNYFIILLSQLTGLVIIYDDLKKDNLWYFKLNHPWIKTQYYNYVTGEPYNYHKPNNDNITVNAFFKIHIFNASSTKIIRFESNNPLALIRPING